ncbi:uncharacterized protein LOC119955052 [Scyliorhinus canicula]|uniref:uncharacterized protein LOC119955052 n=1 Tax=Scyliorhinus canicula TaxID=7830 RepID=UPI0018F79A7C|nr:uncharacterized protein LOC119955052 [Scyliorhinus canicula]
MTMIYHSLLLGMVYLHMFVEKQIHADLTKPSLYLNPPFKVFLSGESVTLICSCQVPITRIHLYRNQEREQILRKDPKNGMREVSFSFSVDQANYTCQWLHGMAGTWRYSEKSDSVEILIGDKPLRPTISRYPSSGVVPIGKKVNISCQGEIRSLGGTFHLYRNKEAEAVQSRTVPDSTQRVTFTIATEKEQTNGSYTCQYETEIQGGMKTSPFSKAVKIIVKDKSQMSTKNSDLEQGDKTAFPLQATLGIAAAIIFVLLAAVVFFFLANGRKSKRHNIPRCTVSENGMSNQGTADLVHHSQSGPLNPEANGLQSEVPENNDQEITYASLNLEVLRRKETDPATFPGTKLPAKETRVEVANKENEDVTYASLKVTKPY